MLWKCNIDEKVYEFKPYYNSDFWYPIPYEIGKKIGLPVSYVYWDDYQLQCFGGSGDQGQISLICCLEPVPKEGDSDG